ncbi:MAG: ABC transporter permease [Burkholderiales bacterium]|nr:ABC transporter permease [Burkholderiales bacterium]MDE2393800.1 ABC transporter permease [Burkholderiales bacterium]MDE2455676.1 ABC transporter permease [Burkholderiales bacterium]
METLAFIWDNLAPIGRMTVDHIEIVGVGVGFAILTGVPLGIAITTNERAAKLVLYIASIIVTVPSVALFGFMIPVLSLIGQGIGFLPTVIALFLYSQLPIVRNTYAAITNIDPALREAARGMGMKTGERLRKVEIPIALPIIMAGVRMAVVINVGIAAIAVYIGAGGLGKLISRGISQSDPRQLIAGAILISVLAIAADFALGWVQWLLTSKGLRSPSLAARIARRFGASAGPRSQPQQAQ